MTYLLWTLAIVGALALLLRLRCLLTGTRPADRTWLVIGFGGWAGWLLGEG